MILREIFCIIFNAMNLLPYNGTNEVVSSKSLITQYFQIMTLIIIYTNPNTPIL